MRTLLWKVVPLLWACVPLSAVQSAPRYLHQTSDGCPPGFYQTDDPRYATHFTAHGNIGFKLESKDKNGATRPYIDCLLANAQAAAAGWNGYETPNSIPRRFTVSVAQSDGFYPMVCTSIASLTENVIKFSDNFMVDNIWMNTHYGMNEQVYAVTAIDTESSYYVVDNAAVLYNNRDFPPGVQCTSSCTQVPDPNEGPDFATVIAHEFGHAFGIGHCTNEGDLMHGGVNPWDCTFFLFGITDEGSGLAYENVACRDLTDDTPVVIRTTGPLNAKLVLRGLRPGHYYNFEHRWTSATGQPMRDRRRLAVRSDPFVLPWESPADHREVRIGVVDDSCTHWLPIREGHLDRSLAPHYGPAARRR